MRSFAALLFGVATMALPSSLALAQEGRPSPWVFGLQAAAVQQFDAGLEKQGSFGVSRWFVQPSVGYAWDRRNSASVALGAGQNQYRFSDSTAIGGAKPWGTIRDARVSLPIRFAPAEAVDVIVIPSVRSFAEKGASLDDGRTQGVLAGGTWRFSPNFAIGPGIGWFSSLDGGANVFPILAIEWDITDSLNLSTGRGLAASQGPGLTLSYEASDQVSLGLAGRYETTQFRLNDDGPAPGGIGEDRSFPLVVSVAYDPTPRVSLSAFAGAEFYGRLRLEDANGNRIDQSDYDPAPLAGIALRARF